MKNDSLSPVRRKPAGGVLFAAICTADNVREAEFSEDGRRCTRFVPCDGGEVMKCRLSEERSSLSEELVVSGGSTAVTHRLRLVADRNTAGAWLEPAFVAEALCRGVVAAVHLADGRRLLLGVSERFGVEQPLRLRSLTVDSGTRATDPPTVEMLLEAVDTAFAAEL